MKAWWGAFLVFTCWSTYAFASEVQIVCSVLFPFVHLRLHYSQTQKEQKRQQCSGMYSKSAWGGDVDPFILTTFSKAEPEGDDDPLVSLVIFEWKDEDLVGVWPSDDAPKVG